MSEKEVTALAVGNWLKAIRQCKERQIESEATIRMLVQALVQERTPWRTIAEALGTSTQAAWEKYRSEEAGKIARGEDTNHVQKDD